MKNSSQDLTEQEITAFFNAYDPLIHQDPYPFYTKMLQDHPAYYIKERNTWIISKHEHVQFILKTPTFIRERSRLEAEPMVMDPRWQNINELERNESRIYS